MDLINQRSNEGMCPICKCSTTEGDDLAGKFRQVEHQNMNVLICNKHQYLEPKITLDEVNEEVKKVRANNYRHKKKRK